MKVILDTNVLLSAFLTDGLCSRILKRARLKHFSFIFCTPVMNETKRLLKDKFLLNDLEIEFFLSILSEAAVEMYTPVGVLSGVCRDPDDDVILLCAAEIQADFLVTGDKDLLELKVYQNFQILSPSNFELLFDD